MTAGGEFPVDRGEIPDDSRELPVDIESPRAFAAPWQAQAFACAIALSRRGLYSWREWVEVFSAEVHGHPVQSGESHDEAYHRQWLAALELLARRKGAISEPELAERTEGWRRAYLGTPHGEPVELRPSVTGDEHPGHRAHPHPIGQRNRARSSVAVPVSISPASTGGATQAPGIRTRALPARASRPPTRGRS